MKKIENVKSVQTNERVRIIEGIIVKLKGMKGDILTMNNELKRVRKLEKQNGKERA